MNLTTIWKTVLLLLAISLPDTAARAEAIIGQPFGVGRINFTIPGDAPPEAVEANAFALQEANGRALYPAFTSGRVLKFLNGLLGAPQSNTPSNLTVTFLFVGDEPLELTILTPSPQKIVLRPQLPAGPRIHETLLMRWWRDYNSIAREQVDQGDYPPMVQTYLTAMLGRRLGLQPPLLSRTQQNDSSELVETLELISGAEELRMSIMRETNVATRVNSEIADQPLPEEIPWTPPQPPPADDSVEIEPMAMRVPHECFYVRFGSFDNFLWFDKLQKEYGGDISRMITLRGFEPNLSARMTRQLALRQSALAEIFGGNVIRDQALIGRDLYLREGAALGVLFQAKNRLLLANDLNNQRATVLREEEKNGATVEKFKVGDHDVSLLSTPDNQVRSYHVADGDFHFVATSLAMIERFLQVRDGRGSLGASEEFRSARGMLSVSRDDTIFVYFSSAFFEGLLSPRYQIELRRRLHAVSDIESMRLARLAAFAERKPDHSIDVLVEGRLLPEGFGRRADGSGPVLVGEQVIDSMRGARGSFLPIPDVPLTKITAAEAAQFARQSDYFGGSWKQMDPLVVGVKRFAMDKKNRRKERISITAFVSPFVEEKYGWITSILGPPSTTRVAPAPGDVITAQAMVKGGLLSPSVPPHHLFLGIQDTQPLTDLKPDGLLKTLQIIRTTPGYIGAWPKPGFLDWLPVGLGGGPPDEYGFSKMLFGVWRRQWDAYSALSLDANLLARVTPHLRVEETGNQAQIRVAVGDLSQSQLQTWVNQMTYSRARQASLGNTRLLHAVTSQFNVPRDQSLPATENLLDASLVCSLGGQYQLVEYPNGDRIWSSDRLREAPASDPPVEYAAPLLEWFRGANAELTKLGDRVVVNATIDMERKPADPAPVGGLPFFKLFGGGEKKTAPAAPDKQPRPAAPKNVKSKPREF